MYEGNEIDHSGEEEVVPQSQIRRTFARQEETFEGDGQEEEEDESKGEETDAEDSTRWEWIGVAVQLIGIHRGLDVPSHGNETRVRFRST